MSATHRTPLLIDSRILAAIIKDTLAAAGADSAVTPKALNRAAARLCGTKFNWGRITGADAPIIAQQISKDAERDMRAALEARQETSEPYHPFTDAMQAAADRLGIPMRNLPFHTPDASDVLGLPVVDDAASDLSRIPTARDVMTSHTEHHYKAYIAAMLQSRRPRAILRHKNMTFAISAAKAAAEEAGYAVEFFDFDRAKFTPFEDNTSVSEISGAAGSVLIMDDITDVEGHASDTDARGRQMLSAPDDHAHELSRIPTARDVLTSHTEHHYKACVDAMIRAQRPHAVLPVQNRDFALRAAEAAAAEAGYRIEVIDLNQAEFAQAKSTEAGTETSRLELGWHHAPARAPLSLTVYFGLHGQPHAKLEALFRACEALPADGLSGSVLLLDDVQQTIMPGIFLNMREHLHIFENPANFPTS